MSVPTSAEIQLLQTRPQNSKLWLSIYQPDIVLSCQVSGTHAKGDRTINYDNVTDGSYLLVENGMTMVVGSAAGLDDFGEIRVKSATASQITVAENSHIDWTDNFYLTILRFFEINAVYPRIIQDPADETNTLWYKDYDIEYTDQNSVLGSFVCMGGHYAGFLDNVTGDFTYHQNVYYSASGTYNLKGEGLSYFWFFQGAETTGSTAHTPGYIEYASPGHYTTRLIVSGTASADVSYRHISLYDRPERGSNTPILNWRLIDINGDRDSGGYTATIRIYSDIDETELKEGSLAILFTDDYYGSANQSIGGNALNRQTILFSGYILNGSIVYNYADSYVEFDIGSPVSVMKEAEGFSISVEDSADPSTLVGTAGTPTPSAWTLLLDMDVRRAIYHYLRWHSTVLKCCDVEFRGTDKAIQYFDSDRSSIYDAISVLMKGALIGSVVNDRQGKLWLETDIYTESSAYETNMGLAKRDWLGSPQIDQKLVNEVSWIEMGGIDYNRTDSAPLISAAPGDAPNYRGGIIRTQGLALEDQAQLNTLVGNVYAHKNAKYPSIDLKLAGNYRNFDIAPQEIVPLTIAATDTNRGISFNNKSFYIQGMRWEFDPRAQILLPSVSLYELTTGFDGDTMAIPPTPPTTSETGGYNIPPIQIPPIPPFPIPTIGGYAPEFVPADYGWNNTTSAAVVPITTAAGYFGIRMTNTEDIQAGAEFGTPIAYAGTITIYAMFSASAGVSGDVFMRNVIRSGFTYNPAAIISPSVPSTNELITIGSSAGGWIGAATVAEITSHTILSLYCYRRAASEATDTWGTYIDFHGWIIVYG